MGDKVTARVDRIEEVGDMLVSLLAENSVEVGYAQLGCAIVLARLSNPKLTELTQDQEVKFVQDLMEWISFYWVEGLPS